MFQIWMESVQQPWLLALLIILGTYILEDAAIISAALLSADGVITPELAFFSLYVGVVTGDLGLYGLGYLLNKWHWLVRWVDTDRVNRSGQWLKKKMTVTVLFVRVVPGLRLPTYVACGFYKLPFGWFLTLVALASLLWTGIVFYGFYLFGSMFWSDLSIWKWLLLPVIIMLVMVGHKAAVKEKTITKSWSFYGQDGRHKRDD